jgi:hypothetical protein
MLAKLPEARPKRAGDGSAPENANDLSSVAEVENARLVSGRAWRYARTRSLLRPGPAMRRPTCQHENSAQAKYCEEWAAPLVRACTRCGVQVWSTAKSCAQCGHLLKPVADDPRFASPESYTPQHLADKILTARAALQGGRKRVTVLFADIKGSMELFAHRVPEDVQKLCDPVLERIGLRKCSACRRNPRPQPLMEARASLRS